MATYRIKAERFSDNELWDCMLDITVENGKIVHVEEVED